jgi:PP-loop superfamily ATP-utilizing enzyme
VRYLVSFSCGVPSAVAAKIALKKYGKKVIVYYCDTFKYEHPDNRRFFLEVQRWLGIKIRVIKSADFSDTHDVWTKTGWLMGIGGARCTTELKKLPRQDFQKPDDVHILGYTYEETKRIELFNKTNPELKTENLLFDNGMTREQCFEYFRSSNIELPMMYRLGYKNNNCIGCVKGQAGYWNKIRVDFPKEFAYMANLERSLGAIGPDGKRKGVAINKRYEGEKRIRVFLDELDPKAGRYDIEPSIECGIFCEREA